MEGSMIPSQCEVEACLQISGRCGEKNASELQQHSNKKSFFSVTRAGRATAKPSQRRMPIAMQHFS